MNYTFSIINNYERFLENHLFYYTVVVKIDSCNVNGYTTNVEKIFLNFYSRYLIFIV